MGNRNDSIKYHDIVPFPLEIIRSKNRKNTCTISIKSDNKIYLYIPQYYRNSQIRELLITKKDWIIKKISERSLHTKTHELQYIDGEKFFLLGEEYQLKTSQSSINKVTINGSYLEIIYKTSARNVLQNYLLNKAKILFEKRLEECYKIFQKIYQNRKLPQLKIRRMKARWGSMSSKGVMTLNLYLICVQEELLDYVIIHELSHLIHYNHSIKFYRTQESLLPDWKSRKTKLNQFSLFIRSL